VSIDDLELVDRIYEAAVVPELWPSVLEGFAARTGNDWAVMLTRRHDAWVGWRASPNIEQRANAYLKSERAGRSQTTARLFAIARPGFIAEHEAFTGDEYRADPFGQWATSLGFHHMAATGILVPSGEAAVIQVARERGSSRYSSEGLLRLDGFRPHLARAAFLAARWKMERLRVAAEALALIGLPAVVVDADCRAVLANRLIENVSEVVWLPKDVVGFKDRAASAALRSAAAAATVGRAASRSIAIRGGEGDRPLVAHLVPLHGDAQALFDGAYALLVLTPVGDSGSVDDVLIQGLFDLTAAESQIAAAVARGWNVDAIARHNGVSRETVRTQLRSVLAKTGTARQAELAAKLAPLKRPLL
jgi:DNA-binding CsgD family transcriptional regulator